MKLNPQFVYSSSYGLGIADASNGNYISSYFKNGMNEVDRNKTVVLSAGFNNFILKENYFYYFTLTTRQRADAIEVVEDSIKINSPEEIVGDVYSSSSGEIYHVKLSFDKARFSSLCTCPVGSLCKHSLALLMHLKKFSKRMLSSSNRLNEEELDLLKSCSCIENLKSFAYSYNQVKALKELFNKKFSLSFLDDVEAYLGMETRYMNPLARLICLYQEKQEVILSYIASNIESTHFRFAKALQLALDCEREYSVGEEAIMYYLNQDYYQLVLLFNNSYVFSNDEITIFNDILDKVEIDDKAYSLLKRVFPYYHPIAKNINSYLAKALSTEQIKGLLELENKDFSISIEGLPFADAISFFSRMSMDERKRFFFHHSEELITKEYSLKFINALYDLSKANPINDGVKKEALNYLSSFNEEAYFSYLFTNGQYEEIPHKDKHPFDENKIDDYYSYSVRCEEGSNNSWMYFYEIYIGNSPKPSITFHELNGMIVPDSKFDLNCQVGRLVFNHLIASTKDKVEEIERKHQEELEQLLAKQKKDAFASSLVKFQSDNVIKTRNLLSPSRNSIFEANIYSEGKVECFIGKDRKYKIKNLEAFIASFHNHEEVVFSKKYTFACEKENFTPFSYDVFNIIKGNLLPRDPLKQERYISKHGIDEILNKYQGRRLVINDHPYFISEERINVLFKINKNKQLVIEPKLDMDNLLFGESNLYYLDNRSESLLIIENGIKNKSLIKLFSDFDGMTMEENEDAFIDCVYSANRDKITLEEGVELVSKNPIDVIEAYFDMENEVITRKDLYLRNNKEIPASSLNDEALEKLQAINEFLNSIGFVNNKLDNDESIYDFLTMDFSLLQNLCNVYLSNTIKQKNIVSFAKQKYHISYNNNLLQVFLEDSSFSDKELEDIYKALKKKKKFIQLKNKTIIDLNNENADEFYDFVESMPLDKKSLHEVKEVPFYNAFKIANLLDDSSIKNFFSNVIEDVSSFKESAIELPSINANLRKYQQEGVKWLNELKKYHLSGILADDMGLGKTLETITFLALDKTPKPSLIVCPKSLIFNWISEFNKFDPATKIVRIYGSQAERITTLKNMKEDERVIYITSYDSLRNDVEEYKNKFQYLILDEAQAIKTFTAKKAISVKRLESEYRFVLTGTPIENNVLELWSIFDFLMPGYLEPIESFKKNFENDDTYKDRIAKRISLFILRRTKKEVLTDLPEKTERIVTAELTTEQRKLYDAFRKEARDTLLSKNSKSFDVLPILMRLRQICVDPALFMDNYQGGSGKMSVLSDTIDELISEGHRMLIFSQFVKGLNQIEQMLKQKNIKYYLLTGETKAENRIELCNSFNSSNDVPVFLISLKAGGNGLNLVGADCVIHLDPWWNLAVENQATDRAHRIGQTRSVEVIKLIAENTIEQRVIELQNLKKDLIDRLISNDDKAITSMTKDDLAFLLDN